MIALALIVFELSFLMHFYAYSPLCNFDTIGNIIMILQLCRTDHDNVSIAYKKDSFCFHTLWLIFPILFPMQFHVRSTIWIDLPFDILSWSFTVMWNRSWRCVTYKNDKSRFHTFWVISSWYFQMQYRVRCITWTPFGNIIMILQSYEVITMCRVYEWQLSLSYLYLWYIIMYFTVIRNRSWRGVAYYKNGNSPPPPPKKSWI